MSGYAWVTLTTNDSYSLGALVLAHSLKQTGTPNQLAVLITPGVSASMREKLASVFNVIQEVNILDSKDESNLKLLKRPELGVTFTKLHCWRLTQFEKCVFLDADTLVLKNADELFDKDEFSAAPDVGWPDCFNSGVFVYRPSNETFEKLVQFALEKGSFDGGDQGLLNLYFSNWAHQDISKHLPFIYNMCSTACYSYLPAFKYFGKDVKIIHFIGATKPWLQYFDMESKQVQPSGDVQHLKSTLQHWWNIFCSAVYPTLSINMSRNRWSNENIIFLICSNYNEKNKISVESTTSEIDSSHSDYTDVWDPWEEYDNSQNETNSQSTTISSRSLNSLDSHHSQTNFITCAAKEIVINTPTSTDEDSHFRNQSSSLNYEQNVFPNNLLEQSCKQEQHTISELPNISDNQGKQSHINNDHSIEIPVHNTTTDTKEPDPELPISCEVSSLTKNNMSYCKDNEEDTGGLAGAFAQISLGSPKTVMQTALEDHMRRQCWESGNIDYMNRDSFDCIWKKISETLAAGPQQQKEQSKQEDNKIKDEILPCTQSPTDIAAPAPKLTSEAPIQAAKVVVSDLPQLEAAFQGQVCSKIQGEQAAQEEEPINAQMALKKPLKPATQEAKQIGKGLGDSNQPKIGALPTTQQTNLRLCSKPEECSQPPALEKTEITTNVPLQLYATLVQPDLNANGVEIKSVPSCPPCPGTIADNSKPEKPCEIISSIAVLKEETTVCTKDCSKYEPLVCSKDVSKQESVIQDAPVTSIKHSPEQEPEVSATEIAAQISPVCSQEDTTCCPVASKQETPVSTKDTSKHEQTVCTKDIMPLAADKEKEMCSTTVAVADLLPERTEITQEAQATKLLHEDKPTRETTKQAESEVIDEYIKVTCRKSKKHKNVPKQVPQAELESAKDVDIKLDSCPEDKTLSSKAAKTEQAKSLKLDVEKLCPKQAESIPQEQNKREIEKSWPKQPESILQEQNKSQVEKSCPKQAESIPQEQKKPEMEMSCPKQAESIPTEQRKPEVEKSCPKQADSIPKEQKPEMEKSCPEEPVNSPQEQKKPEIKKSCPKQAESIPKEEKKPEVEKYCPEQAERIPKEQKKPGIEKSCPKQAESIPQEQKHRANKKKNSKKIPQPEEQLADVPKSPEEKEASPETPTASEKPNQEKALVIDSGLPATPPSLSPLDQQEKQTQQPVSELVLKPKPASDKASVVQPAKQKTQLITLDNVKAVILEAGKVLNEQIHNQPDWLMVEKPHPDQTAKPSADQPAKVSIDEAAKTNTDEVAKPSSDQPAKSCVEQAPKPPPRKVAGGKKGKSKK